MKILQRINLTFIHICRVIYEAFRNRFFWLSVISRSPRNTRIGWNTKFLNTDIHIGENTIVEDHACLESGKPATSQHLKIGNNCWIRSFARIHCWRGTVEIGDNSSINAYSVIYGTGGVKIGKGVRIATHTVIVASTHKYQRLDIPIYQQGWAAKGIQIEDGVWIGCNSAILDGVTVGHDSIVAAGAVVINDVPPYAIVGGVPAKVIRSRDDHLVSSEQEG
jgi:acetyltransferase-like isoleucine patch superfamily enzyme